MTGKTQAEIASEFDFSEDTVRRVIRGIHFELPKEEKTNITRPFAGWQKTLNMINKPSQPPTATLQEQPQPVRKPRRETIFSWVAKWEAAFDGRFEG
jgi:transcriptional antiterminator